MVEWREGVSPSRSPRTGRDSLPSSSSYCPALIKMALLYSQGSSHFWLTCKYSQTTQPLRSSSITEPSSLLLAAPSLCSASVLSLLWVLHLNFSLIIGTTGSHVPHKSLDQVRATFMPDAAQAVNRSLLDLSWRPVGPPVLTSSSSFRHLISSSLTLASLNLT